MQTMKEASIEDYKFAIKQIVRDAMRQVSKDVRAPYVVRKGIVKPLKK